MSGRTFLLIGLVLYLAGLPFYGNGERSALNADSRTHRAGAFIELPDGVTHYDDLGLHRDEVVVFVHGFSSPYYIWGKLSPMVRSAGYRTVRYDLFGRGASDRPDVDYGLDLYDRQLEDLLRVLGIHHRVHLIGLSMGGAIAAEFVRRHPDRVASLTLIDCAGFSDDLPLIVRLIQMPLLGEFLMYSFGDRILRGGNVRAVYDDSKAEALTRSFSVQMQYPGFKRALLSTLRHTPLQSMEDAYADVGKVGVPTLVVWGRQDEINPVRHAHEVKKLVPQAQVHLIPEAGHLPHYEKPHIVGPKVLDFLEAVVSATAAAG